jgi:uncharacterized protein (TIGR03067 family)
MRTIVAMALLSMLLACRLATVPATEEGDGEKILGNWIVSVGTKAGRKAPEERLKGMEVTFTTDSFLWRTGDKETREPFSLDPVRSPRQTSMNLPGKSLSGIYRFERDELMIRVVVDEDQPADFTTKDGAKVVLIVLERKKARNGQ